MSYIDNPKTGGTGPTGPRGPGGPPGPEGPEGDVGDPGPPGPPGPTGATGATGSPGSQGVPGVPGPPGEDGEDGLAGPPGPPGTTGATGATGASGIPGTQGPPGNDGDDGEQGPPGARGLQGATGTSGPPGPPGNDGDDEAPCIVPAVTNSGDPLTQYTKLAGRPGTTNDTLLTTTTGGLGTLYGASESTGSLGLQANTAAYADANTGRIKVFERMQVMPSNISLGGFATLTKFFEFPAIYTTGGGVLNCIAFTGELRMNVAPVFGLSGTLFLHAGTCRITTNMTIGVPSGFTSEINYIADGAVCTFLDNPTSSSFRANPVFTVANSGSYAGVYTGFAAGNGNIATGVNVPTVRGFLFTDFLGAGTITNQIGYDVGALTQGTTLTVGFRTAIAAAAGRWGMLDTGGANHAFKGSVRFGDNTAPTALLDVATSGTIGHLRMGGIAGNPAAPTDGDHWYNTTQKSHRVQATVGTEGLVGLVFTNTADSTPVNNTGAETLFDKNFTFPASSLTVGKSVRVHAVGKYGTTGTPTMELKVKAGTSVLYDSGAVTVGTSVSNRGWTVDCTFTIRTTGAPGTATGGGVATFNTAATALLSGTVVPDNSGSVNITITGTLQVGVSVQWGTAANANTATLEEITIEVLD